MFRFFVKKLSSYNTYLKLNTILHLVVPSTSHIVMRHGPLLGDSQLFYKLIRITRNDSTQ